MKKNKNKKLRYILILLLIVVLVFIGTMYFIINKSNSYSFSEKKWINDQLNTSVDVEVETDLPIFSLNGEGVFYDYIRSLETDTGLSFNVIHTNSDITSFEVKSSLDSNDLLLFRDHYVVLSKNAVNIGSLNDLKNKVIGVLSKDLTNVSYYLTEYSSITFKTYSSMDEMQVGLNNNDIFLAIVPQYEYIDDILESNLVIDYHLNGLYSYFTISLKEKNKQLNGILEKFLNRWSEELKNKINEYFLELYYDINNYSELDKESIVTDDFIVGYIQNIPYEGKVNRLFTGINNEYLSAFGDLTDATYKYVEYSTLDKLTDALNNKKIDIAYNPYSLTNPYFSNSINIGNTEFVVLAHHESTIVVNSIYSLSNYTVSMVADMNLTNTIGNKKLFTIKTYKNISLLLKNIEKDSIIIIEKSIYDYYKDNKLSDYSIRLLDTVKLNDNYLLSSENEPFNKLFNFYISTQSRQEMELTGIKNSIKIAHTKIISSFLINNVVYVSLAGIIIIIIIYRFTNKLYVSKRIKKEDRMLYLDVLTNLKNRNYLNDNINYWEKNRVFPQTIVLMDLNRIKELNDKKGHEEGDKQIRAAANVLIRTQRENSEIMRTDGNEFMIYLVGYDEKVVTSYLHKLYREFKSSLPYEKYGVAIGYSMIDNELKTIDDAINEAAIMMRDNKGEESERQD